MFINTAKNLECDFFELPFPFPYKIPEEVRLAVLDEIEKALRGEKRSDRCFEIGKLGVGTVFVRFNDEELLKRFATISEGSRVFFLASIQRAFYQAQVEEIRLMIPWHSSHPRRSKCVILRREGAGVLFTFP